MPTVSFFFYLLSVALAVLFRLSYRGWFGSYLLLSMVMAPLLIFLLSLPAMFSLDLKTDAHPHVSKKCPGELTLQFSSKRLLPIGLVRVCIQIDNRFTGECSRSTVVYHGLCPGTQTVSFPTEICGQLRIKVLRWECRDLLGFFSLRKPCPEPLFCTVLPPAQGPETSVDFDSAFKSAAQLKPKYGGGFSEDHDLRDYRPGDSSNSIHWKLSSKADKLIVREALEQDNKDIFLVLLHAGPEARGLEVLYWLSLELCRRELPHILVANALYPVTNEAECVAALSGILSTPPVSPCSFDASKARCIFRVFSGEVTVR